MKGSFLLLWLAGLSLSRCFASEPSCFRTKEEAAEQTGARGLDGYRMESIRRDPFDENVWAFVRSCEHPGWAGSWVLAGSHRQFRSDLGTALAKPLTTQVAVLQAGTKVRLFLEGGAAHIETAGTALSSGAIGQAIRVRLLPFSDPAGPEQIASGVIEGKDLVRVAQR